MSQIAHPLPRETRKVSVEAERAFPWLRLLPAGERSRFFADLFLALGQALGERDWSVVENLVARWQATAEVLAVPELAHVLSEPIGAGEWEDWDDVEAALFGLTA